MREALDWLSGTRQSKMRANKSPLWPRRGSGGRAPKVNTSGKAGTGSQEDNLRLGVSPLASAAYGSGLELAPKPSNM